MTHSDIERVWVSRVSFGVAAVALSAMVYGGCQQKGGEPTNTRAEPAAATPVTKPAGEVAQTPKVVPAVGEAKPLPAPVAESKAPVAKTDAVAPNAPTAAELEGSLVVKRLQATGEVKDREPVSTTEFNVGGPVLAFVEMSNTADVEQTIVVTFEGADAKKVGFVELTVPAKQLRWRTWGQTKNIRAAGEWTAVVSTKDGTELSRTKFEVEEATIPAG